MATSKLHSYTVHHSRATINILHSLFHFTTTLSLLYYRFSHLLRRDVPIFPWTLLTVAELIFTLTCLLSQAFRWRPLTRATYPERIPGGTDLPGIDVFICTADPSKEPVLEVMNTVLSAMALDYPAEKLAVYLSDDGGAPATLYGVKEACGFAREWVPFCRRYGIKSRCPEAYFSSFGDDERFLLKGDEMFKEEEQKIKSAYDLFKKNVENASGLDVVHDRPPRVEVIHDNKKDGVKGNDQSNLPLLVYVSREKRPSHPHRFKAGALNALLRVSGIMSNGPFVLVLDCDMYCNDPASAMHAMCFHLDPQMAPSLGFVQYPQVFHNVSKNDIYDGQARSAYMTLWQGMDGLRGPVFTGTGYYLNRKALYKSPSQDDALREPEKYFGLSSKFIASLSTYQDTNGKGIQSDSILEEARNLATCTFEKGTKWGKEIGYSYDSLLESTFTGYLLHCKGWRSVYLYPKRPCFLGCAPVDMKDSSIQQMKWSSGLFQIGFSKFSPFTYGVSRMSILQSMCYGTFTFFPLYSVAFMLYGTVPQFCLMSGTPLFPKVSDPWFAVFAIVYASSTAQHLCEVLSTGGSIRTWWNEHRMWMMRAVTSCLFGCLDAVTKWLGITKATFRLTNKAIDKEKLEKYEKGKFDFQGAEMFMVPMILLVIWNIICFTGGLKGLVFQRNFEEMFVQVFLSVAVLVIGYPVLEGMVQIKGK